MKSLIPVDKRWKNSDRPPEDGEKRCSPSLR